MKRVAIAGALAGVTAVAVMGCRSQAEGDTEATTSALYSLTAQVRAYKQADGGAAILFRQTGQSTISELRGTPGARIMTNIGGVQGGTPWGYKRSDNVNAVVYIDSNRHLHELSQWGGVWTDNDFYSVYGINAPLAATSGQEVFGYARADGVNTIIYTDSNKHIIEVSSNFGGSGPPWRPNDLTALFGAPVSYSQSPYPFRGVYNTDAIVYGASDQHIHALWLVSGAWADHDLSIASGDLMSPSSQPWANGNRNEASVPGNNQVVFTGTDLKLHRLYDSGACGGAGWCSEILPSSNISPSHRPVSFFSPDFSLSFLYVEGGLGAGDKLHLVSKPRDNPVLSWTDTVIYSGGTSSLGDPFGYVPEALARVSVVFTKAATAGGTWGVEAWKPCVPGAGGYWGGAGGATVPCSPPPWFSEEF